MKFDTVKGLFSFRAPLAASVLGVLFASQISAAIISVNIDENQGRRPMAATDLAGVSADATRVANWNNFRNQSNPTVTGNNLVSDDGSTVGGTFAFQYITSRASSLGVTTATNDVQMFNGANTLFNTDTLTVNLTNIPFAAYDLYIYTTGQNATRGGIDLALRRGHVLQSCGGHPRCVRKRVCSDHHHQL